MSLPDVTALTDEELDDLVAAATAEQRVRRAVGEAPERAAEEQERHAERMDTIAAAWHMGQGGIGTPEEPRQWEPVTAPHEAWPRGSWVICDGVLWHNPDHPANVWRPGDVGSPWVRQDDADPDTGHIAWAVGQDVKVGDLRTHDGRLWEARLDHVTHVGWEPSPAAHAVWTDLGPLEDA